MASSYDGYFADSTMYTNVREVLRSNDFTVIRRLQSKKSMKTSLLPVTRR